MLQITDCDTCIHRHPSSPPDMTPISHLLPFHSILPPFPSLNASGSTSKPVANLCKTRAEERRLYFPYELAVDPPSSTLLRADRSGDTGER